MNNKGFAITSIIYGLMLLFVLAVTSMLAIIVGRNRRMDELFVGIRDSLEYPEINIEVIDNIFYIKEGTEHIEYNYEFNGNNVNNVYVTEKRGKYNFKSTLNSDIVECSVYLPKNVVVITSSENELYYKVSGGEDTSTYKELCPEFKK